MESPPHTIMASQSDVSGTQGLSITPASRCDTKLQQIEPTAPGTSCEVGFHVSQRVNAIRAQNEVISRDGDGNGDGDIDDSNQGLIMVKLQKNSSMGAAPTTLHGFSRLPPELRQMIWERCIPHKIVRPWYTESLSIRWPRKFPVIATVNREAMQVALRLGGWTRVQVKSNVTIGTLYRWNASDLRRIWLNKKDIVYLGFHGLRPFLLDPAELNAGANGISRSAQDPATRLIVSCALGPGLSSPRNRTYRKGQPLKDKYTTAPAGKKLYENFLRGRKSIMMEVHHFNVLLEGPARESAIQAGMFGLWGDEPAIVDASGFTTLRKYKDLLEQGNGMWAIDRTTDADMLYGAQAMEALDRDQAKNCRYSGRRTAAVFMSRLLDVLGNLAEIEFDWDWVVGRNGKVNKDHSMVKKLGLPLPDWTPVIVFELLSEEDTKREKELYGLFV